MVKIKIENVRKEFGKTVAVDNVSLEIADKEFLTLLGPSGSEVPISVTDAPFLRDLSSQVPLVRCA